MTLRPVAPDPELIAWLWSEEGIVWHRQHAKRAMHQAALFAEIKEDHGCAPGQPCHAGIYSPHCDGIIFSDIRDYGMSGVPEEWKQR